MKLKIFIFIAASSILLLSSPVLAQVVDEVRQDLIQENRDEIKSIREEILRQKDRSPKRKPKGKRPFKKRLKKAKGLKLSERDARSLLNQKNCLKP